MATVKLAETVEVLSRRVGRERASDVLAPLVDGPVAQLISLDAARAWRMGDLRARHATLTALDARSRSPTAR